MKKKSEPKKPVVPQPVQVQATPQKTAVPQCTVYVPAGHDILFKVIPSEEYFKRGHQTAAEDILSDFGLDERTQLISKIKYQAELDFANRLDFLMWKLPEGIVKDIAISYMDVRGIQGNKKEIHVLGDIVHITNSEGKVLNLRLSHILSTICSFPPKTQAERNSKEIAKYKKIDKTQTIDAKTKKSF